jgi:hypothetical protein
MRDSDRKNNMMKANLLAESHYKLRNNENFDYAAAEREFHDKQDYEDSLEQPKMGNDEDSLRREINNEDYDYAGEERAYQDKQDYESSVDNSIDNKFSNKNSIVNALYKILKNANVEGRYTDEHWAGISKLNDVFNKYNINYDLVDAKYEHNSDFKTQLPNSKVYTYMIKVMDKNGKEHQLPLRVTCAFVGRTGTMADEIYELTYYFAV